MILGQTIPANEIDQLAAALQGLDFVTSLFLVIILLILILLGTLFVAVWAIRSSGKERHDESLLQGKNLDVLLKMQDNNNKAILSFARMVRLWESEQKENRIRELKQTEHTLKIEALISSYSKEILLQFQRLYKRIEQLEEKHHGKSQESTKPPFMVSPQPQRNPSFGGSFSQRDSGLHTRIEGD